MERIGLAPGAQIGGYTVVAPLGAGGAGAVYRAVDDGGSAVALKLLHPQAEDSAARARLRREVAALQKLRHPAVAQVLDAELDSAEAFLVTELVDGIDLEARVREGGPLDADDLHALAAGLHDALAAVHAAGVLHRDVKPANVLLTDDGPVLIDFGLAQGTEDVRVTSTGIVVGTPGYLAPEILDGDEPGESADWWGWSAALAFAATGRPPFGKGRVATVLARSRAGKADLVGLGQLTRAALRGALVAEPDERTAPSDVVSALYVVAAEGDLMPRPRKPRTGATPVAEPPSDTAVLGADGTTTALAGADGTTIVDPGDAATAPAGPGETVALEDDNPAPTAVVVPAQDGHTRALAPAPDREALDETSLDDDWDDEPYYGEDDPYAAVEWIESDLESSAGPPVPGSGYVRPRVVGRWVTQAALAALVFACGARWPGQTLAVAAVAMLLARTFGFAVETTHTRRERRGVRDSDWWLAALGAPWHLVRALVGLVPAVLVAGSVVVIGAGVVWWFVGEGRWAIGDNQPGDELAGRTAQLLVGGAVLLAVALVWWGPASRMTRVGALRLLEIVSPRRLGALVAIVVVLAAALWIARAIREGGSIDWHPLPVPTVPAPSPDPAGEP